MSLKIFKGDLRNEIHEKMFIRLLNEYISDKMGGGEIYNDEKSGKLAADLLNFPTFMPVFAVIDDIYAGMAACFFGYSTFNAKKIINVHDIIVSKGYRNMGIGRSMLEHIIQTGKETGCCKITLEVRVDNENAKHLYRTLGFKDSSPPMLFWHKPVD